MSHRSATATAPQRDAYLVAGTVRRTPDGRRWVTLGRVDQYDQPMFADAALPAHLRDRHAIAGPEIVCRHGVMVDPTGEENASVLALPAGAEGFWQILAHNRGANRRYVVSGTFPDGDAALAHAKRVCNTLDPFGGDWHFSVEFVDTDLVAATELAEIDPDEPVMSGPAYLLEDDLQLNLDPDAVYLTDDAGKGVARG